ncbi:hypothetical protein RJI07_04350 [Mycoplasmatota bacterium WC30]
MKKLVVLLMFFALIIGLTGCDKSNTTEITTSDVTTVDVTTVDVTTEATTTTEAQNIIDELISPPTNLTITGTVLSWTAVADADGYIVYANGAEADVVTTTSFDFGSLVGDRLIFRVRARAPRGMEDSPLSAQVAYVANKDAEIIEANLALSNSDFDLPEDFAAELIDKGMLGEEVEDLVLRMDTFSLAMESVEGFDDFFTALDEMLAEVDNIEAVVSALVITMLPEQIAIAISDLDETISTYETMLELYPDYTWYETYIENAEQEKAMLVDLLGSIETDAERIILAITTTVEYFISIEEMISDDFINSIVGLSEIDTVSNLNVSEMVLIKEEMVTILTETMPTQEDMLLIMEVYDLLVVASGATVIDSAVDNYMGKSVTQMLYTLEAFINFLDTLDEDFFTDIKGYFASDLSYEMINGEVSILLIKYFKIFKDANQDLLDTMNEVFTEEERELLLDEYIDMVETMEGEEYNLAYDSLSNVSFQTLMYLQVMMEDSFDNLLDMFVERDGEVVRLAIINSNYYYWYSETYGNYALDETYSRSEYYHEMALSEYKLMEEVVYLVNAVLAELTDADYEKVIEIIFDMLPIDPDMFYDEYDEATLTLIAGIIESAMTDTSANQLELIQNLTQYIVDENVFEQFYNLEVNVEAYYVSEYGNDYYNNYEYWDDDYSENATLILFADFYTEFMITVNRDNLDSILEVVFDTMLEGDIQLVIGMTTSEIAEMETNVSDLLDYVSLQLADIKTLDAENLSTIDLLLIENFRTGLSTLMVELVGGAYE